ncbi:nuclear transport factor 2 family protein [Sphingomonas sp. DC2300-3]|uniref:nuclear transport factor 2 family protein n=1 Tax=unclassified Sphingomonas TaxID=196159 RepID=UPI003CF0C87A
MDRVAEVERCEARLRSAMVAGDVETLSMLIDPGLVFTGPDGSVLTREQDLAAHAEGLLNLSRLDLSDTRYTVIGDMVLVTTKATLVGRFADAVIDGLYAYTRLWRNTGVGWAVVAGQAARIG